MIYRKMCKFLHFLFFIYLILDNLLVIFDNLWDNIEEFCIVSSFIMSVLYISIVFKTFLLHYLSPSFLSSWLLLSELLLLCIHTYTRFLLSPCSVPYVHVLRSDQLGLNNPSVFVLVKHQFCHQQQIYRIILQFFIWVQGLVKRSQSNLLSCYLVLPFFRSYLDNYIVEILEVWLSYTYRRYYHAIGLLLFWLPIQWCSLGLWSGSFIKPNWDGWPTLIHYLHFNQLDCCCICYLLQKCFIEKGESYNSLSV